MIKRIAKFLKFGASAIGPEKAVAEATAQSKQILVNAG